MNSAKEGSTRATSDEMRAGTLPQTSVRQGHLREGRPARLRRHLVLFLNGWSQRHFSDIGNSNVDWASEGPQGFAAVISVVRP